ncbi:APC family permease [Acidianus manzaensis]|uniref:Amino acid permease n=1 Tax=Acidianus manzaensis TaxID=282676 RepID=A0A1W6JYF0_9CREN|nr:APC family permease [Acidianus manzaensis]ARM75341.1 amino acid permease [Acidianus manzaensis]
MRKSKLLSTEVGWLKKETLHILDLVPLSTSSVAPTFSIAAAYGSMVALMGPYAIMGVVTSFPFFLFAAIIFRQLNKKAPHCGASYHWGTRFIGKKYGGFQFWIVTLAYFLSLPPIIIPAGEYTLDMFYRLGLITRTMELSIFWDSIVGIIWAIIAAIPLLLGAKPTARFTEAFLFLELVILSAFIVIGITSLSTHIVNSFSWSWFFAPKWFSSSSYFFGLAATMVIVATILDGWEIDSYAAEESKKPKLWPGLSGIIGLISVFIIYMITMPIMTIETPISALSSSVDPLARWASYVIPQYVWLLDIAVITSTASSLWLTSYILIRAWYSAGREGLLPKTFAWTSEKFKSPWFATIISTLAMIIVQLIELTSPSIQSFFGLVLTAAGAFLLAEFGIDSITATIMWWREKAITMRDWIIRVIAPITAFGMIGTIIMGIIDAGPAFGYTTTEYGITLLAMASIGLVFLFKKFNVIIPDWLKEDNKVKERNLK